MRFRVLTLALTVALVGLFVAAPMSAGAAAPQARANSLSVPITGTVNGVLNITSFALNNGQLVANGTFTSGSQTVPVNNIPVNLQQSTASCTILHLVLGPLDLNLLGLMVHLNQVVLDVTAQPGPGNLLGNLLCDIANLLNPPAGALTAAALPTDELVGLLNQVLGLVGPQAIPAVATFADTLNVTRFASQNGQLMALGSLASLPGQTIALPVDLAQSTGTCQILDLVLGPLDLNLLGLMVHLDQVHLNITAQSGSGNLLGNLLCAVAHLLDNGGPTSGLAALLNNLLRNL